MQKQAEAVDNESRTFIHDVRHRVKAAEESQRPKHGIQQKQKEREREKRTKSVAVDCTVDTVCFLLP